MPVLLLFLDQVSVSQGFGNFRDFDEEYGGKVRVQVFRPFKNPYPHQE
jgi:hypothetical protein